MTNHKVNKEQLRMRVFAGPNGSGKSTIIHSVKNLKINDKKIDFGYYINADDIAVLLRGAGVDFNVYSIKVNNKEFKSISLNSGLINDDFDENVFLKSYFIRKNILRCKDKNRVVRLAQIVADFLRHKMLSEKKKFTFETVFSHHSKLDIIRKAVSLGYKVYLYFISTESSHINEYRVALRKEKGGHDVPIEKIHSRYIRSLELLFEAAQESYQVFFFDNSRENQPIAFFANFKLVGEKKEWKFNDEVLIPEWFKKYYSSKIK